MSRIIPVPLPQVPRTPFSPEAPVYPTSSFHLLTSSEPLEEVENKENVPPPEPAGLLFSPTASTHDKEASKTGHSQTATFGFGRLGIDDGDLGEGDDGDLVLVPRVPKPTTTKVLSVILDQRLRRKLSASTLSSGTEYTSEFGLSRCSSPTRPLTRPRTSGGSTLSRLVHSEDPDKWAQVEDYVAARSATPVGAICPLPVPDTLGIESLIVAESPRPLANGAELPAEGLAVLRVAMDAAEDADEDVNEVKQKEWPLLSGSREIPIELLPDLDPEWEDKNSGVDRDE